MQTVSPTPTRLDQLTSLRFFAALAVLASHLWELEEWPNPLQPLARTVFHEGYAGVSFFFVLSGYILAHSYGAKLREGAVSRRTYWLLRVARIGPPHWLVALPFALAALWSAGAASLPVTLANLALLHAWVPSAGWYFSLNEPSWSLSDELFFYTVFAFAALWPGRRVAGLAALLLAGNALVCLWFATHGLGAIRAQGAPTPSHWPTYILPLARLPDFLIGMVLYRAPRPRLSRATALVLEAGAVLVLLGLMAWLPGSGVTEIWRMELAYLPPMALVVWAFGLGAGPLAQGLARSRALVLLGDASFALYLVHLPVLHGVLAWFEGFDEPPLSPLGFAALCTVAAVLASVAFHLTLEKPLHRRLRRWIERR